MYEDTIDRLEQALDGLAVDRPPRGVDVRFLQPILGCEDSERWYRQTLGSIVSVNDKVFKVSVEFENTLQTFILPTARWREFVRVENHRPRWGFDAGDYEL